jgi:hypothetical protein
MAPIPDHEKSGNRKCHQISQLSISLLKCRVIRGIGEKFSEKKVTCSDAIFYHVLRYCKNHFIQCVIQVTTIFWGIERRFYETSR